MKKLLILVEDEKSIVGILKEEIKKSGINVEVALNGLIGMAKIKKDKPDLVLLDLILPNKSGLDILKEMRNDPELKDIPVIILSNLADDDHLKETISLGISDYLVKSNHELREVVSTVNKYINK